MKISIKNLKNNLKTKESIDSKDFIKIDKDFLNKYVLN
jgi:hypothetical protein